MRELCTYLLLIILVSLCTVLFARALDIELDRPSTPEVSDCKTFR